MINPPSFEQISVFIDNVDLPSRTVQAQDRTGGKITATFYGIVDQDRIPNAGESWIAERHSWDSWRLTSRMPDVAEETVIDELSPGDRYISAEGSIKLYGEELLFNDAPIEGGGGGAPSGPAGGDLTGTYPNPTIGSGKVTSDHIANGAIVNVDINASAAIALSKLATDPLARANHTGSQVASTISDFDEKARRHSWFWG